MAVNYEARVLSALLKRQDMLAILGEPLDSMMVTCGDIWQFIRNYYQKNRELPTPKVVQEMFPADFIYEEDIEGTTKHHIEVLRTVTIKSRTEEMLEKSQKNLREGAFSPQKIVEHLSKRLSEVQREMGISRSVDIRDVDDALEHYDKIRRIAEEHDGQPGIPFGFKYMDDNYPTGMAPGHLGVIMGYSGKGKTWFTIKLMVNAWLRGYPVLFINLEMSPEELRDRVYFLISQYTMTDFARASIDPNNFRAWAETFMKDKPEFNIVGNDNFGDFSVDMVHAKIEQFKPALVGLDYLSLFTDRAHSEQETTRMKNLSRQLKQLAMACQVPIIAIAAVTGKDKKDRVNPPDIAQVAWSSGIEYDANFAIAVHTNMDAQGRAEKTEIVCRKNRHGALYSFYVRMDLVNGTIEEIDEIEQMEMLLDEDSDELSFLDAPNEKDEEQAKQPV